MLTCALTLTCKHKGQPRTVGNHYSSLFSSSEAPAKALLNDAEAVADVGNWSAYVSALTRSSLPEWYEHTGAHCCSIVLWFNVFGVCDFWGSVVCLEFENWKRRELRMG